MAIPSLYLFNVSHFSEKARWALDHKGVRYQPVVLLPGPHRLTMRRLAGKKTEVPLLLHDGVAVQGSSNIIDHADRMWGERRLTPAGQEAEAAELERSLDRDIGENGRRVLYSCALDRPDVTVALFTAGGPRWGKLFYRFAYRSIAGVIRDVYQVEPDRVAQSKQVVARAVAGLEDRLQGRRYLFGDQLSRADITAAALLAPLFAPPEHPCRWGEVRAALPDWQAFAAGFDRSPVGDWVRRLYRERRASA